MKAKKMKVVCLSLMTLMMGAMPLSVSAASSATARATYTYTPYNGDLHNVYINGKYQYREAHKWEYSATMVYCAKCGVYQ